MMIDRLHSTRPTCNAALIQVIPLFLSPCLSQVHENYAAETQDHEDHTFCGIMFDVAVPETGIPLDYVAVTSVAVRGMLGKLTVWSAPDGHDGKHEDKDKWTLVYEGEHKPSVRALVPLKLAAPLKLGPGQRAALYVHSKRPGDQAIVYDNQRGDVTCADRFVTVSPGLAHLSNKPFGGRNPWGWGGACPSQFRGTPDCNDSAALHSYGLDFHCC